jgi:hypothetical protein
MDFFKDCQLPLVDVVCKDRLPDRKLIGDYVINMQNNDDGDGTHWTFAKIINKKNPVDWFNRSKTKGFYSICTMMPQIMNNSIQMMIIYRIILF